MLQRQPEATVTNVFSHIRSMHHCIRGSRPDHKKCKSVLRCRAACVFSVRESVSCSVGNQICPNSRLIEARNVHSDASTASCLKPYQRFPSRLQVACGHAFRRSGAPNQPSMMPSLRKAHVPAQCLFFSYCTIRAQNAGPALDSASLVLVEAPFAFPIIKCDKHKEKSFTVNSNIFRLRPIAKFPGL
jgi:hypothetical protein